MRQDVAGVSPVKAQTREGGREISPGADVGKLDLRLKRRYVRQSGLQCSVRSTTTTPRAARARASALGQPGRVGLTSQAALRWALERCGQRPRERE